MKTPAEIIAHDAARRLLWNVLNCKNTMDRVALCYGVLRRPDAADLMVAADWCIEQGLVNYGTTNASARAWSRGDSDQLLYLTKAGRAWVKAAQSAFNGNMLGYAKALHAARQAVEPRPCKCPDCRPAVAA